MKYCKANLYFSALRNKSRAAFSRKDMENPGSTSRRKAWVEVPQSAALLAYYFTSSDRCRESMDRGLEVYAPREILSVVQDQGSGT